MTDDQPQPTLSKKANAKKSFGLFALSIFLVLSVRWILFEPFVIPSGSMIPTLLINDHILVTKFSFGIRLPFSRKWLTSPQLPNRGDVVVFRSVENDGFFMIKRVIGLPGDTVDYNDKGELRINGQLVAYTPEDLPETYTENDLGVNRLGLQSFRTHTGNHTHWTLLDANAFRYTESSRVIGEGKIFLMGDNRDRSRDSRFWGELPLENLLGKAQYVWLSCDKTLSQVQFLCDPRFIRWQRLFLRIE